MSGSFGMLDGLVGYRFDSNNCSGIDVSSAVSAGTGASESLASLTGTVDGSSVLFPQGSGTFTVDSVDDVDNTITFSGVLANGDTVPPAVWTVLGLSAGALLMTSLPRATFLQAVDAFQSDPASLNAYVVSLSAVPPPVVGTAIGFTPSADVNLACFAQGTRILTARGEVAVEDVRQGDLVPAQMEGRLAAVGWIGHRAVAVSRHPRPWDVAPVRVRAGAFGPGRPHRDLLLSPDHAVRVGESLVPIRYLLNGATIAQEFPDRITYFHVELDAHDVLLAEGLPCESYLDTGNRGAFGNGGGPVSLVPDFSRDVWAHRGCLPLVMAGPAVVAEKRRLLERAEAMGWRLTTQPNICVLANGRPVPVQACGVAWRAELPAGTSQVRLLSRAAVPAEMSATVRDGRRLGIAVAELRLDRVAPPAGCYGRGWHAAEAGWRWTDGDAHLSTQGAREIIFAVALTETYWLPAPSLPASQTRAA